MGSENDKTLHDTAKSNALKVAAALTLVGSAVVLTTAPLMAEGDADSSSSAGASSSSSPVCPPSNPHE